jgi:hypothetical protein
VLEAFGQIVDVGECRRAERVVEGVCLAFETLLRLTFHLGQPEQEARVGVQLLDRTPATAPLIVALGIRARWSISLAHSTRRVRGRKVCRSEFWGRW